MITYRTFKNADPPRMVEFWNAAGQTRGFGKLSGCDALEQLIFAKPYFDRNGLLLAFDGDRLVGWCHAGFSFDDDAQFLDKSTGTICMLLVHPSYRKQGIGGELLQRAQQYLSTGGAKVQYAGSLAPLNPFYMGMYGGSECPGILESEPSALQFLEKRGYESVDTTHIFQIRLDQLETPVDNRLPLLRRNTQLTVEAWPTPAQWQKACNLGPMVTLGYQMIERNDGKLVGKAWVWEMDAFARAWQESAVGITDVDIVESYRNQGYGKLLVFSILKYLKEHNIALVEVQTMERNEAACRLYRAVGFQQVDTGRMLRRNSTIG